MKHNILYSFRRCPYAIRARWALLNTVDSVILREVDLKQKPKELLDLSPKGTVPVLVTKEGRVIDESLEIIKWAIRDYSIKDSLLGLCIRKEREINSLISQIDYDFKYHLDRFKYASRYKIDEKALHQSAAINILISLDKKILHNKKNGRGFLVSDHETIADWAIWPFIRQYRIADREEFDQNKNLSNINEWLSHYLNHKKYKVLMTKFAPWQKEQDPMHLNSNLTI